MVFLNDLVGSIEIDTADARKFVKAWFRPDDVIGLVAMSPSKHGRKPISRPVKAIDLMDLSAIDISEMSILKNGEKLNSYITIFPVKSAEKVELHKRGSEENVGDVLGVFVDLDVKPGCFDSKEEIYEFLENEVPRPTIVVNNGETGGVHAYWRLPWNEVGDKSLLTRWWSFMAEAANGRKIDKLTDLTRISRLPSGIYWPKEDSSAGKVDTVKVVWADGPQYPLEELLKVSEPAHKRRTERIEKLWQTDTESKLSADELARLALDEDGDLDEWGLYSAIARIEEVFNELFTWDDILAPCGWTYIREDNQGRREWARPGSDSKSATTDYDQSPNMMSLLSSSEDTGLADLKDANIPLTKLRVAQRLLFNDSVEALTRHVLRLMKD